MTAMSASRRLAQEAIDGPGDLAPQSGTACECFSRAQRRAGAPAARQRRQRADTACNSGLENLHGSRGPAGLRSDPEHAVDKAEHSSQSLGTQTPTRSLPEVQVWRVEGSGY